MTSLAASLLFLFLHQPHCTSHQVYYTLSCSPNSSFYSQEVCELRTEWQPPVGKWVALNVQKKVFTSASPGIFLRTLSFRKWCALYSLKRSFQTLLNGFEEAWMRRFSRYIYKLFSAEILFCHDLRNLHYSQHFFPVYWSVYIRHPAASSHTLKICPYYCVSHCVYLWLIHSM